MRKTDSFVYSYLLTVGILWILTSSTPTSLPFTSTEGLNFYGTTNFGFSVARAGDINGDGIDDIVIGSPNAYTLSGVAYVVYGSKTGLTDLGSANLATLFADGKGFQIKGYGSSQLGYSVDCAGDVNGDGIEDLIIGAPFYNANFGMAYVMFGKRTGLRDLNLPTDVATNSIGFGIVGPAGSDLGYSVSGAGDVNGDGIDDIIVGAPNFNNLGAAYVIYGKTTGLSTLSLAVGTNLVLSNQGFTIKGTSMSELGYSVSGAGDVNGDGVKDVVIGAYNYNLGCGYAAVLLGSRSQLLDLNLVPSTPLSGRGYIIASSTNSYLGMSVSGAGDINGDGLSDVIIGGKYASFTNPAVAYAGSVFVIYGSRTIYSQINLASNLAISSSIGFRITSGVYKNFLGSSVSNSGDLNGDGIDDIIIGGAGGNMPPSGSVYIIYGSRTGLGNIDGITPTNFVDASKGFVISNIFSVYFVNSAGDFNGDGGQDIIIGGLSINTAQPAAYVLFGTPGQVVPTPSTNTNIQGLDPSQIASLNAMTQTLATAGKATSAAVASISIINFSNPTAAILKSISDTIYFIKYLNISYPPKLQYILDNYQSEDLITISSVSSAPQGLVDDMTRYPLPSKFRKYDDVDGFHSSFLINFWSSLIVICVILIIVLITNIFKPCSNYHGSGGRGKLRGFIKWICSSLSQTVKWNLMFSRFTDYYGSISLFTSIEIRTTRLNSFLEVLSLCICIIVTLGLLLVQIRMILVVRKLQNAKLRAKQKNNIKILEATEKKLKDYVIVFERFRDGSFFQQSFLFFYNLRIYIFYAIISWLDDALVQTLLNTTMEATMMLYLVISRPLKSKIELAQYLVIEAIFLIVNICTLGLALLDFYESDNEQSRVGLGDAILLCNSALMYCALAFLFLSVLLMLPSLVKLVKQRSFKKKKIQKIQKRDIVKYHHDHDDNANENDASNMELNPNNNSISMNASDNNTRKIVRTERRTPRFNPNSTVQSHSKISIANQLDKQTLGYPPQENFLNKQRRALRLQRVNLNGLRLDSNK